MKYDQSCIGVVADDVLLVWTSFAYSLVARRRHGEGNYMSLWSLLAGRVVTLSVSTDCNLL